LKQLASATHQPVEQVVETAVQEYLDALESHALQAESEIFWARQAELARVYPRQAVALYQGEVVDHDADLAALEARVRERFGLLPVLVAPVDPPPPRELHWRGGRLTPEKAP